MSWATIRRSELPDGSLRAIKETTYDARLEARGLWALRDAGAQVPEIHEVTPTRIVMDWVDGPADWEGLGRRLATVHRTSAAAFGFPHNNMIGALAQRNDWHDTWGEFFAATRVRDHLDDTAVPTGLARRLARACHGPLQTLLDEHNPTPSLIHGDLWSGNIVGGRWLIDPAVAFADREMELAFLTMFGGVPGALEAAYRDEWPLDDGWEARRPALRLHHLLVHVRLFGGSYVDRLAATLDELGW